MSDSTRSKRINIRLSDRAYDNLVEWAERMGVAPSTLATVAIGEYLEQKSATREAMKRSQLLQSKMIGESMAQTFSDPEKIASLMQGMISDDSNSEISEVIASKIEQKIEGV